MLRSVWWLMASVSLVFCGVAISFAIAHNAWLCVLFAVCAVVAFPKPDTVYRQKSGSAYGIPYYLVFDSSRRFYEANVYGYHATAPHETAIKEVIFKRLTQAVARRAVESCIKKVQHERSILRRGL